MLSLCMFVRFLRSIVFFDLVFFFFQAEDGIRDLVRSRGLGDVYKRQPRSVPVGEAAPADDTEVFVQTCLWCFKVEPHPHACLLYTSDAADERSSVDLGGRRILKQKN